jgi:hypothetical protein
MCRFPKWGLSTITLLAVLAFGAHHIVFGAEPTEGRKIRVTAEGEEGWTEQLPPGQLVHFGITLRLGDRPEINLSVEDENRDRIFAAKRFYAASPGVPKQLVGVRITNDLIDGEYRVVNPLEKLSDAEIGRLWGIEIERWAPSVAAMLARIDPEHCLVMIKCDNEFEPGEVLPHLPADLRNLQIDLSTSKPAPKVDGLRRFTRLRHLTIRTLGLDEFDCRHVERAREMEYLDVSGMELADTHALGRLVGLRELRASYCESLRNIDFAGSLTNLETLDIERTAVDDLSPLEGLAKLRTVDADTSPIRMLPRSLPALKSLSIFSTELDDETVATFRRAHPDCTVDHRWQVSLEARLTNIIRVRIRSGGTCHRELDDEKTLFETVRPDEIKQLISAIEVTESRSGAHCMCCGNPSLEFYDAQRLKLTLGFHHGRALRWPGGWPSDAGLSAASSELLVQWLAFHGVNGPRDERIKAQERARERPKKTRAK